jgi:hypothetical protein
VIRAEIMTCPFHDIRMAVGGHWHGVEVVPAEIMSPDG